MSGQIVREAFLRVTEWGIQHRTAQLRAAWTRLLRALVGKSRRSTLL
jgi:hypothetical protein